MLRSRLPMLLAVFAPGLADAATITFAGRDVGIFVSDNDSVDRWRTNTVAKPFDANGDNVYGTNGYVLYGTDAIGNANPNVYGPANPLTYSSGSVQTLGSIPSYLTLSNNGQNFVAATAGYRQIDNPSLPVGASVPDLETGAASRDAVTPGTEVPVLNITVGAGFPAAGLRVGMFAQNADQYQGTIRLTQTAGGSASVTVAQVLADIASDLYFFDITGAAPGDVFTLFLEKDAVQPTGRPAVGNTNPNVLYGGLTFDVIAPVPEPAALFAALLAAAAPIGFARRLRASPSLPSA